MKSIHILLIALCGLLFALTGCTTTDRTVAPGTLFVQVSVPLTWNTFIDDHVADSFTQRVREGIKRRGFTPPVESLSRIDDESKAINVLTIYLNEWRVSRTGNISCTFNASLKTPAGTKELGSYMNTTMHWMGMGRFGLERSFNDAADGAIRDMCEDIVKSEMLPSLQPKK